MVCFLLEKEDDVDGKEPLSSLEEETESDSSKATGLDDKAIYLDEYVKEAERETDSSDKYQRLAQVRGPTLLELSLNLLEAEESYLPKVVSSTDSEYLYNPINQSFAYEVKEEEEAATEYDATMDLIKNYSVDQEPVVETDPLNDRSEDGDDCTWRAYTFLRSAQRAVERSEAELYWQKVHQY